MLKGKALSGLAAVEEHLGDTETALDMVRESYEFEKSQENDYSMAVDLGSIGRLLTKLGRYDEAEDAILEALALNEAANDGIGIAYKRLYLEEIEKNRGNREQACAHYLAAYQTFFPRGYEDDRTAASNGMDSTCNP